MRPEKERENMTALFWRRVGRVLSTVFAGVAVLLAMLLAGVRLVGLHPYAVLSNTIGIP